MAGLSGYVAVGIVSLVVGLLLRLLEPKAKIVYWFPHEFLFELKDKNVVLQTNSLTVQNAGRKPGENIEIIHKQKPDFFKVWPSLPYEEETTPAGEHVIRVKTLGPKEFFMLQLLSYKTVPNVLNIRSKDGPAEGIRIKPYKTFPRWFEVVSAGLFFIGLGFAIYWCIKAIIFISKNIGIV